MAARVISGTEGTISITGHPGKARSWSAILTQDANDATGFSSSGWREFYGGLKSFSFRASGYIQFDGAGTAPTIGTSTAATAALAAAGATFTLTAATGCTYTGTAIVSSLEIGTGVDGNATYAISGVATGSVGETWDQS